MYQHTAYNSRDREQKGRGGTKGGEAHPSAFISDALGLQVLAAIRHGGSPEAIAERFGVSRRTVSRIRIGDGRWATLHDMQEAAA